MLDDHSKPEEEKEESANEPAEQENEHPASEPEQPAFDAPSKENPPGSIDQEPDTLGSKKEPETTPPLPPLEKPPLENALPTAPEPDPNNIAAKTAPTNADQTAHSPQQDNASSNAHNNATYKDAEAVASEERPNKEQENTLLLQIGVGLAGALVLFLLFVFARKLFQLNPPGQEVAITQEQPQAGGDPNMTAADTLTKVGPPPPPSYAKKLQFNFRETDFLGFRVHTDSVQVRLFYLNRDGSPIRSLERVRDSILKEEKKFFFATNGGIFHGDLSPVGLCIIEGHELRPLETKPGNGNFYLQPNGVFYVLENGRMGVLETNAYQEANLVPRYATQSGPMLLIDGEVHPAFNADSPNMLVRSGVGVINAREVVFLLSEEPVRFFDFAMVFRDRYRCQNALYLDGVISQVLIGESGQTLSTDFSTIIAVQQ